MELVDEGTVFFEFEDIKIHVRSKASAEDAMQLEALSAEAVQNVHLGKLPKMGAEIVKMFVTGWTGVTRAGVPVPYSYDAMVKGLPAAKADTFMPALCRFVAANVDILQKG